MKKIYALILSFIAFNCMAQLSLTQMGTTITIDFENSNLGVNNGAFTAAGITPTPTSGQLNSNAWSVNGLSQGDLNFGQTGTSSDYAQGTSPGGVFSGGIYAWMNGMDTGLGVQPTGSDFTPGNITLKIDNNTGAAIDSITFSYDLWINNDADRANSFNPSYSLDNINYTDLTILNDTSSELSSGMVSWATTNKSVTIAVSIPANGSIYFRWSSDDISGSGGRDEFAIDDIAITPYGSATAPTAYTLQILHASDLEGGVEAIDRARYFAALVDTLEDTYANSITLSAGDNYIPGPFFNAAADRATFRDGGVFNNVYNRHFGVTSYDGLREEGGRADISIMNIIGFDASAIGNHEFDAGADAMESIIEEDFRSPNGPAADRWVGAQFPYLSANLDFSASSDLGNLYTANVLENTTFASGPTESTAGNSSINKIAAATFINEGGEKIGVVGATTPRVASISSPGAVAVKGPSTNDMMSLAAEIQPYVDSLRTNHGINKIILVTHLQQLALEEQLATMMSGVDVIIAGGSDAILANANDRLAAGSTPLKPYPVLTTNSDNEPLAIVSTDGEYSYVGRLVVGFDTNGVLIPATIDSTISGPYIADSMMVASTYGTANAFGDPNNKAALVDSIASAVRRVVTSKDGNTFGKTDVYLNGERASVRTEETNFGNLTADANLWTARQFDPSVQVSLKNGGGMRAAIGEVVETSPGVFQTLPPQANPLSGKQTGEVSQLDIENSLRFNNGLTVMDLTADGLKQVVEHAVSAWAPGATPGQFSQVGGLRFSFDPKATAGSRIQSMVIVDSAGNFTDTIVKEGALFGASTRTIKIVTLDFLAGGGDGYPYPTLGSNRVDLDTVSTLPAGAATFQTSGTEQDALADYLVAFHDTTAFDAEDTDIDEDMRIENLMFKADDIFGVGVEFDEDKLSYDEAAGTINLQVNFDNVTSSDVVVNFNVLPLSTLSSADYTLNLSDTAKANQSGSFDLSFVINDDANMEDDEFLVIAIDTDTNSYFVEEGNNEYLIVFIRDNDNNGPTASQSITLNYITSYNGLSGSGNSMEILDFDPMSQRLFVTNADKDRFEILDMSDPRNIAKIDSIDISSFGAINSLSVHNGIIATAIEANTTMGAGTVAFYDTTGALLSNVTVGVLPDMVTFTPNGNKVVVACEGEPDDNYVMDPEGSIAIIDVSGGAANVTQSDVTLLNFNAFDSQISSLRSQGIRIFGPNASVSQDMEPEYVAISPDNSTAYVACQENNAVVIVNLNTNTISAIAPLGTKDHSLSGNGLDSDRRSDEIHIATAPFKGFYMPDAIASYEVAGNTYIISANEGDSRDYNGYSEENRLDDLTLDPTAFPEPEVLFDVYGDIKVTLANGDTDNDGDFDEIYTYGARSFSIWNGTTGALVYDSGDDFEQIVSNHPEYNVLFNTSGSGLTIKNRSDDKGPEPEAVVVGKIQNTDYAFVGMERTGGVIVYDVSNPNSPSFVDINIPRDTATGGGDLGPEGLIFIEKSNSPTGTHLLVSANEVSSTITVWEINDTLTSISEIEKRDQLAVYPNPTKDELFITSEGDDIQSIELHDMSGRLVRSVAIPKGIYTLSLEGLESNVYILSVYTEAGIKTTKVIKH